MSKLTQQLLLKMTPELNALIDKAFEQYLKQTGKYITRAEFIRGLIEQQCGENLERNGGKQRTIKH